MELGECVARHGFIVASSTVDPPSMNTVFSPYCSFVTNCGAAVLCISRNQKSQIFRSLGFSDTFGGDDSFVMKSLRHLMYECETIGADAPGFLQFTEFISQKKDSPLKYLEPRPLNLMYKTLKTRIRELFPEFARVWDDDELFMKVKDIAERDPDDHRIQDLISCTEVPLGLLRNAPLLRCFVGMWHDPDELNAKLSELSSTLKIPIERMKFPEPGRQKINTKVAEWTNSAIPEIVQAEMVNPVTHLLLTSTMVIDAKWKHPFQTVELKPFKLMNGQERSVAAMIQVCEDARYFESKQYQALELPLVGTSVAFVFVLYRSMKCEHMSYERFRNVVGKLESRKVLIQIPRFEVNFGPMSLRRLLPEEYEGEVTDVIQQISLGCYQDGTRPSSKDRTDTVGDCETKFVADRPFLYYVRDSSNGAILFMGRIMNPLNEPPEEEPAPKETFLTETATQGTWEEEAKEPEPIQVPEPEPVVSKPPSPKPVVPDDSDLMEFVYGDKPRKPVPQQELDRFFGVETKRRVTYPKYSPFLNVELRPPPVYENKDASYEVIRAKLQLKYPRLPKLDVPKSKTELAIHKPNNYSAHPKFHSADSRPVKRLAYPRPTKASRLRRPL